MHGSGGTFSWEAFFQSGLSIAQPYAGLLARCTTLSMPAQNLERGHDSADIQQYQPSYQEVGAFCEHSVEYPMRRITYSFGAQRMKSTLSGRFLVLHILESTI